jgi:hypothetical protein
VKDRCEDEVLLKWPTRQGSGRLKKTAALELPRIPRITRLMALAIKLQDMVDGGEIRDYAELARLGYVSRARITQIMNLINLAPDIQQELLSPDGVTKVTVLGERKLRKVTALVSWHDQRRLWGRLRFLDTTPATEAAAIHNRGQ